MTCVWYKNGITSNHVLDLIGGFTPIVKRNGTIIALSRFYLGYNPIALSTCLMCHIHLSCVYNELQSTWPFKNEGEGSSITYFGVRRISK